MKDFIKNVKYTWKYMKDQKLNLLLYFICNIIGSIISICMPILSAKTIVNLTANKLKQVLYISIIILAVEIITNLIRYFTRYFSQVIYRETFIKIQCSLGKEVLKIENKCLDTNTSGMFIQRLTTDTGRIADIYNMLNTQLLNIVTDIGIFVAIFIINKIAFLYVLVMIIVIYIVDSKRMKIFFKKDKEFRKDSERVAGFVGELVRGVRDIKMLNAEKSFMKELNVKIDDINQKKYAMNKVDRNYTLLKNCIDDLFTTGLIFLLVYLITKNVLTTAMALVLYNYLGRVTSITSLISSFIERVKDFNLSAERIYEIIEGKTFTKEKFGKKELEKIKGNFEFKNVCFSYNDEQDILNDLSFKVNANETVAFVGKSGSGKTTIFNLLCKMYDIKSGEILIDGINIDELTKDSLRGNITIISQNPYIFNMTIRENLKLVKSDLTEEEMIKACKLACLHDYIETLPDKYDTLLGEGGINLSGGQRQRLAIARAFVQKTEIILFDEATSALDNETQANIQKAIENLQKKYTILIIAHRLSTVINSDRILFLDDGKIVAEGTHKELLVKCDGYKQLYENEMTK